MYEYLLSYDVAFVLVFHPFGCVFLTLMYISAPLCAVGTPSEFSSVPILVADELAHSFIL